jgi:CheY-like chemotaxis protein
MRVALFDDDLLTRAGARHVLEAEPAIESVAVHSLRRGLELSPGELGPWDCVVVDIHDQTRARWEVGTDVYAGIELIERLRAAGSRARVVAITPTRADPLLTERLIGCRVDQLHERCDFQRPADLIGAVLRPSERHRPVRYPAWVLIEEGLVFDADPNRAMAAYKASPLYGRVRPDVTQVAMGSRRAAVALRDRVIATGFVGTGARPRWNEVRDYLLKLAGRLPVDARPVRPDRSRSGR